MDTIEYATFRYNTVEMENELKVIKLFAIALPQCKYNVWMFLLNEYKLCILMIQVDSPLTTLQQNEVPVHRKMDNLLQC